MNLTWPACTYFKVPPTIMQLTSRIVQDFVTSSFFGPSNPYGFWMVHIFACSIFIIFFLKSTLSCSKFLYFKLPWKIHLLWTISQVFEHLKDTARRSFVWFSIFSSVFFQILLHLKFVLIFFPNFTLITYLPYFYFIYFSVLWPHIR